LVSFPPCYYYPRHLVMLMVTLPSRGPGRTLTVVGLAIVGAGIGFNYVAKTMRENELAQKKSGTGNFYVSVDRSGGGI
ncbi:hypothetical protein OQA88_12885, partial [Cercophora sp. LCS_1]